MNAKVWCMQQSLPAKQSGIAGINGTRTVTALFFWQLLLLFLMCFDMCSQRFKFNWSWDGPLSPSFNLGSVCHPRRVKEENPAH